MTLFCEWQVLPIEELREKAFTKFAIRLQTVQLLYVSAGLFCGLCVIDNEDKIHL